MKCTLEILSSEIDTESLQDLTLQLASTINSETDVCANIPEQTPQPGERGGPVTLGVLALTFLSSGAATALLQVFKALCERNSSLEISIERLDGHKINIKAENLSQKRIDATLAEMRAFLHEESLEQP